MPMILDGDHISQVLSNARNEAIICAPFIKESTFKKLIEGIPDEVDLKIYTRWDAYEVAVGVSDIDIFNVIAKRKNTTLFLIPRLHAKLYSADNIIWVGSANVTGAALGWSNTPNIEILVQTSWEVPSIERMCLFLNTATEATEEDYKRIKHEAKNINIEEAALKIHKEEPTVDFLKIWVPKCSVPEILFSVYRNEEKKVYTSGAVSDARYDIDCLNVPPRLSESAFIKYISSQLEFSPLFASVIKEAPSRLTEEKGKMLIRESLPEADDVELRLYWHVVIQWVRVFLGDRFDVVPTSFEVRLK
jgi:hypothetical protein